MALFFPEHLERPSRYVPWHNHITRLRWEYDTGMGMLKYDAENCPFCG